MQKKIQTFFKGGGAREISPDEIFLDASNLPAFDVHQFEGRFEKPIAIRALIMLGSFFFLVTLIFSGKLWTLQVRDSAIYTARSENNRLEHTVMFAQRGIVYDRNGVELAWNTPHAGSGEEEFALRTYTEEAGLAHVLGYGSYPQKDSAGFYYRTDFVGESGVEKSFDGSLRGENGLRIVERDVFRTVQSESSMHPAKDGNLLTLALDANVQNTLYATIKAVADQAGFVGGAGVLMDTATGELLALASYPEYRSNVLSSKSDEEAIRGYTRDPRKPFLNRAVSGLYSPGSIIKPFIALGALEERVIDPSTTIVSTGSISLPNPYLPGAVSVFRDWKAHGAVDMRKALAVSSDVYFYEVGGGFKGQRGLGIANIEKYMALFGFGTTTGINLPGELRGVIPTPAWKKEHFEDSLWRIGDTYNTAIGQYGFQVTALQMARAIAAIANNGKLLTPRVDRVLSPASIVAAKEIHLTPEHFTVVQEGMREAVRSGTAAGLALPGVSIAAKTGTAQVGLANKEKNSWVVGFFPYEHPRYSFAVVLEQGPAGNTPGGVLAMRDLLAWMSIHTPEYLK